MERIAPPWSIGRPRKLTPVDFIKPQVGNVPVRHSLDDMVALHREMGRRTRIKLNPDAFAKAEREWLRDLPRTLSNWLRSDYEDYIADHTRPDPAEYFEQYRRAQKLAPPGTGIFILLTEDGEPLTPYEQRKYMDTMRLNAGHRSYRLDHLAKDFTGGYTPTKEELQTLGHPAPYVRNYYWRGERQIAEPSKLAFIIRDIAAGKLK